MEPARRTARLTGLAYLGLALTGMVGYLLIRSQLVVAGDAATTLSNLTESEGLARLGVVADLGIVLTQALTALLFYRLFRGVSSLAAGALAAFGLINAVVILISAGLSATALAVLHDPSGAPEGDVAGTVQLLYTAGENLWSVAGLFFGLWLIPMGWLVVRSGWMPAVLGWILLAGGALYLLNTTLATLLVDSGVAGQLLTIPATIGEFWILGYLIFKGVRPAAGADAKDREGSLSGLLAGRRS